jgi:superfamily II DNA or RNA helicase
MYKAGQSRDNFLPILADATSLVVFDEAHQSIAATYAFVLDILASKRRGASALGLTATPGRTYNDLFEDSRLSQFWSGEKVMLEVEGYENPVDYLIEAGYLARPSFRTVNVEPGIVVTAADLRKMESDLDLPESTLNQLEQDEKWNAAVLGEVCDLVSSGHKRVIVFATTVRQALVLSSVMQAMGNNARVVTGDTPKAERESILAQYASNTEQPMVLFNFGVLTTGFDAPATSAAVIARPTKSLVLFSQMAGRAMRGPRAGGNERAEIVSVIDPNMPGFGDPAEAFTNWEDVW